MKIQLQFFTGVCLALAVGLSTGCPAETPEDPTTDTGGSDDTTSTTEGATGQNPTTDDTGSGSGSASATTTSATDESESASETGPVCPAPDAEELGGSCSDACGCLSGECFVVGPIGGVCSECDSDEDCPEENSGCNFGNPLTGMAAVCGSGTIGEGCETDDACADPNLCATIIEVPGIISASTCGECVEDGDCMGGQLCSPTYDIMAIGGHYLCVDPGTIADNEGCEVTGSGNEQCMSGNCAPASLMGIPVLGVCSECNEDSDCGGGTCQLPEIAIEGESLALVPGMCV